jgi:rhodanese-related sulfurtransferase
MRQFLIPLLLISGVAATPIFADSPAPAPAAAAAHSDDISFADLTKAIADKTATIIDVNGSDSFASGRIPGAIDFEATKDLASKLPADKSALIVAYCGGPSCGAWKQGAKAAKALGYTNVVHFSGGISGWKSAGGTVEK